MARGLTQKQSDFAKHYVASGNGTEASRVAGYVGSDSVLGVTAFDNLRNPKIKAEIARLRAGAEKKLGKRIATAIEVLAELSEIALAPWREFLEIKYNEEGDVLQASLRVADKIRACELLGKKYKLFTERVEVVDLRKEANLAYEQLLTEFPLANPQSVKMMVANDFGIDAQQLGSIG